MSSRLSKKALSVESTRALLVDFAAQASEMLLFLKSIETLRVLEWREGEAAPTLLREVALEGSSAELRVQRETVLSALGAAPRAPVAVDFELRLRVTNCAAPEQQQQRTERWLVCNQLGGGRATALARCKEHAHLRLVPWSGVAARLDADAPPLEGRAYCFLPLPVRTGLRVHVNGFFERDHSVSTECILSIENSVYIRSGV